MPIYNKERYLSSCIQSIQKQTLKDIEIIAVNDHSSDGTLNKLINYAKKDPRIKLVINERNRGLLYSRAMGILNSSGEYLMNLDPDDELSSDDESLEYLYNKAKSGNIDIISFGLLFKKYNIKVIKCSNKYKIEKQPQLFKSIFDSQNMLTEVFIVNKLIKKEIFLKAYEAFKKEIYNGKWNYFEDNIWSILVNSIAQTKQCTDKIIYIYNNNKDSLTTTNFSLIEFENLIYRHEMYKKLFTSKENEKYLIGEYYFLLNSLKSKQKYLLLLNEHNINAKFVKIFQFFLDNYICSSTQKNYINNFIKIISIKENVINSNSFKSNLA